MSFDLLITAISLAMAAGTIWGSPKEERKKATIATVVCGVLVIAALFGYKRYEAYSRQTEVAEMGNLVLRELNQPKTFDDVFTNLNFPSFDLVNDAFDFLYEAKKIRPTVVDGKGPDGKPHKLRLFSKL